MKFTFSISSFVVSNSDDKYNANLTINQKSEQNERDVRSRISLHLFSNLIYFIYFNL